MGWGFSGWSLRAKTKTINCNDGTSREIYKNIDDACPLYINGYKADITGDIKGVDSLAGAAKASYESKIQGLLFGLNEQNQSLMMSFRTIYLLYMSNPCGNDDFFKREIEKLLDEQRKIGALKIKISFLIHLANNSPNDMVAITQSFNDIASTMGGPAIANAASMEIADSRNTAKMVLGESQ